MPRGNPNWGKDQSAASLPIATAFELKAGELGLAPDQYARSMELREWAAAHKNTRYIPETLLKAWGLAPDTHF